MRRLSRPAYDLIPSLARQLAEGQDPDPETVRAFPRLEPITVEQWNSHILAIASGVPARRATRQSGIPPSLLWRYLRAEPALREQYYAVVRSRRSWRCWSRLTVEAVLDEIGSSALSSRQACAKHGQHYRGFLRLVMREPDLRTRYFTLKESQAARLRNEILEEVERSEAPNRAAYRAARRSTNKALQRIRALAPVCRRPPKRQLTPLEAARKRAGLRLINGKPRGPTP